MFPLPQVSCSEDCGLRLCACVCVCTCMLVPIKFGFTSKGLGRERQLTEAGVSVRLARRSASSIHTHLTNVCQMEESVLDEPYRSESVTAPDLGSMT